MSHPELGPTVSLPHIPLERFWLTSFFSWEQRCLPFRSTLLKGTKRKRKSQRLRVNAGRGVSVKEASQQTSGSHGNQAWMLAKHGNVAQSSTPHLSSTLVLSHPCPSTHTAASHPSSSAAAPHCFPFHSPNLLLCPSCKQAMTDERG